MDNSLVVESADELFYMAENDIINVIKLLDGKYYPADRMYHIICFHAAQAVEKFLKGYIINNGKNIKKTHDLNYLHNISMKINISFSKITDDCSTLNKFLPDIKYSSINLITKQNMNKIIKSLETISNFPPIKAMRVSFSEKHKYEIVTEITVTPSMSKPANGKKKNIPGYDMR